MMKDQQKGCDKRERKNIFSLLLLSISTAFLLLRPLFCFSFSSFIFYPSLNKDIPALEKFYKRYIFCKLFEGSLFLSIWFVSLTLLILLLAYLVSGEVARIAAFIFILAVPIFLMFIFRKVKNPFQIKFFCRLLEGKSSVFKDLLNAVELVQMMPREGVSSELKSALVHSVQERMDNESPERWISLRMGFDRLKVLVLLIGIAFSLFMLPPRPLISGWNRLFFGVQQEILRHLSILPQGGKVILGEPVIVSVELIDTDSPIPRLFVEGSTGWEEMGGEVSGRKSTFQFKSITKTTKYKIRWKDMESFVYRFDPVESPRLTDFTVKMIYPDYTGLPVKILKEEPQFRTFRGTKIEIEAQSTKELERAEMVSSNGVHYPTRLTKGKKIGVSFVVQNPFEFWFELRDTDGLSPLQPVRYNVTIKEDTPPEIRLLAPTADLIVGKESQIPFTFEFKDDLGVTSVFLKVMRDESASSQKILLKRYPPPLAEKIDHAEFNMSSLKTASGEIIKLQLEVQDNDLVAGPKSGYSDTILVEIQSYEKEHAQIENDLKDFRKDLMDLLADQTEARVPTEEWQSLSLNPAELNQKLDETVKKQSQINSKTDQAEKKLEKILSRMERDPLSDFSVWSEHRAMREALQSVRSGAMEQAQKSLSEKNFEDAVQNQDSAIAELERLSNLAEEVHKYSKMKDLMHAADRLTEKGENLNQKLSASESVNPELLQLLQETLKEAGEILMAIQKQIQDLPKELPEEFVNRPAVKHLNLSEMANSMQQLAQSLQRGDIQAALKMAQELLRQAKAARETIAKASEDVFSSSIGDLTKKVEEKQNVLQKIIDEQENLLRKTDQLESKRQQFLLEWQKHILEELAGRQKKVLDDSQVLLGQLRSVSQPSNAEMANLLSPTISKMEKVLKEFEQKNVMFSQKWLQEIIQQLEPVKKIEEKFTLICQSTSNAVPSSLNEIEKVKRENFQVLSHSKKLNGIRTEEELILESLKKPPTAQESPFPPEDLSELQKLSQEQNNLAEETKKLRNEISQLASKSALVNPESLESMKGAHGEMRSSEKSLDNAQTESAQQHQQKALSYLRKGQENFGNVQKQLGQAGQMGMPQKSDMIQPRNQPGGQFGFRKGVVKIPRADEYLPPREFREELLESLKERYPKSQENVIKDYYKKLSQ